MPNTWSLTDKTSDIGLTNGNLTATQTNPFNSAQGVRSVDSQSSGKFYWEYTFVNNTNDACGIANGTVALSSLGQGGAAGAAYVNSSGAIQINSTTGSAVLPGFSNGNVACIAIDLDAKLLWMRNGATGNWNASGTANPATGTGGLSISFLGAGVATFAVMSTSNAAPSAAITANFGASAFTGAVPSGFTSGFNAAGAAPPPAQQYAVSVIVA